MTVEQLNTKIKADKSMQDLAREDPTEFTAQVNQLYHSQGYDEHGGPLPLVQQGFGKLSRATGIPEGAIQGAAAFPIPAATTIAGSALTPIAPVAGASMGSLAGEEINSLLGITEPMTPESRVLSMVAPLAGPAISRAKSGLAYASRALPGGGAGMHELAAETLNENLKKVRVTKSMVDSARASLIGAKDFSIKVPNLTKLLDTEIATVAKRSELPGSEAYLYKLNEMRAAVSGDRFMSFKKLMAWEQGFNDLKHSNPHEVWSAAAGTLVKDIEAAVLNPKLSPATKAKAVEGLNAFKKIVTTSKRYRADESLDKLMSQVVTPVKGAEDTLVQFNKKALLQGLHNNTTITDAFDTNELKLIEDAVSDIGYLSSPPAQFSSNPLGFIGQSGAGAALGWTQGGATGALVGYAGQQLLTKALSTEPGRKIIKYLAKEGRGKINMLELQSMTGKLVAGMAGGAAAVLPTNEGTNAFENQP